MLLFQLDARILLYSVYQIRLRRRLAALCHTPGVRSAACSPQVLPPCGDISTGHEGDLQLTLRQGPARRAVLISYYRAERRLLLSGEGAACRCSRVRTPTCSEVWSSARPAPEQACAGLPVLLPHAVLPAAAASSDDVPPARGEGQLIPVRGSDTAQWSVGCPSQGGTAQPSEMASVRLLVCAAWCCATIPTLRRLRAPCPLLNAPSSLRSSVRLPLLRRTPLLRSGLSAIAPATQTRRLRP